jgi:sodium/proline symporter
VGTTLLDNNRWLVLSSFFLSLLIFTGIGALSSLSRKSTTEDYLLAGREMPPWLVALSAVATLSSGFMFVGQIGLTYRVGLSSMWWLVGWTVGDLLAWLFVYERLRRLSEERREISVLALLGTRSDKGRRVLVPLAAGLTVFYLAMYAAAQLKAGSTALQSIFGMPASTGAILGAVVVVIYCYAGGIRASIWTDGAQSLVMFVSMALLTAVAAARVGGPPELMAALAEIDPALAQPLPQKLPLGFGIYLAGMVFGGLGVVGQPHILVRSMSIRDPRRIRTARLYYFLWLVPFYVMAIFVGLYARVLLPDLGGAGTTLASEQALPLLSIDLLPDLLIGLMLAGLFSATMSTADSQILACTSAVTQDLQPRWSGSYSVSKLTTLAVTATALGIALGSPAGVFDLVLDAWAVLSCTLGPLLILRLFDLPCSQRTGVLMIAVGFVATHLWGMSDYAGATYVNFPGMAAAFAAWLAARALHRLR